MSLYRTYRPQSFEDVVGQEHVVATLQAAVAQDKLTHAYLFAGPRATGKTSIARILAKSMLTRGVDDPQRRALILKGVEDGNLVDLTEIDAASNRGIDDIRDLVEKIQFSPVIAAAKVYIIDEVHMLTKEAFNALLKTLEEPPPYAFFILATTELHKIPATIQSRCQRFLFRQHAEDDVVSRLKFVADKEGIVIDEPALRMVARAARGGMRDALALLDQLRSLPAITAQHVRERIGESGHEHAEALLEAIRAQDRAGILKTIKTLEETSVPFEVVVRLLLAAVREDVHGAVDAGKDPAGALRLLETLLECAKDIRSAPVPALALEARLLELCDPAGSAPASSRPAPTAPSAPAPSAPSKASSTASKVTSAPSAPAPSSGPAAQAAPAPLIATPAPITAVAASPTPHPQPPATGAPDFDSIRSAWPAIVAAVEPASARMSLKNGQLRGVEGKELVVAFTSAFHRDKALTPEAQQAVEAAMKNALGSFLQLRGELAAQLATPPQPDLAAVNLAEAAADVF